MLARMLLSIIWTEAGSLCPDKRSRGDDDRRKGADIRDGQRTHKYSRIESTPKTESKTSSREEFRDKDGHIKPEFFSDQGPMCFKCRG